MIDPNFAAVMDWLRASCQYISANLPAALATTFTAFFGTFIGAYCAFLFERRHKKTLARDADLAAGRQAQFALSSQLKTMRTIRKEYLDPEEGDERRYVTLQSYPVLSDDHYPTLPFNQLGYFLEGGAGAHILGQTMVAEDGFFRFVRLLEQRNLYHESMQRVMAQQGARVGLDVYDAVNRAMVKRMTDSLYESADDVLKHHEASLKKIQGYLKKRFPKYRALGVEP